VSCTTHAQSPQQKGANAKPSRGRLRAPSIRNARTKKLKMRTQSSDGSQAQSGPTKTTGPTKRLTKETNAHDLQKPVQTNKKNGGELTTQVACTLKDVDCTRAAPPRMACLRVTPSTGALSGFRPRRPSAAGKQAPVEISRCLDDSDPSKSSINGTRKSTNKHAISVCRRWKKTLYTYS
jgi:hypothetical protein